MNKVILMGRLGKDPETRTLDSTSVTSFSLATTKSYKDKSGERKEKTEWHNVVFWGKLGETVSKFHKKGDAILIEGEITYREYEKDGVKRFITDILGNSFYFMPKSNGTNQNNPSPIDLDGSGEDDLPF